MENKAIVVVGQQPWDTEIGSNCKSIAKEFSKTNRVLYVNSPLDRITAIRQRKSEKVKRRLAVIHGKENGLLKIQDNLWNLYPDCLAESINWISLPFVFDWINRKNGKKFAAAIKRAMAVLDFKEVYLFNDNELIKCFYLNELLKPVKSVYYSRDYILATEYWRKRGPRLEPILIRKNDVCVANSAYLSDYCRQYNPESFDVGQGCDFQSFDPGALARPPEFLAISYPVIGYVGALISSRLDIDLLKFLAAGRPDYNFVLVGPEDEDFSNSDLHLFKNVHFLGPRPIENLPAYINSFDVCLNPQLMNDLTIGNYPRKIDEYLFMGKPVVATKTKAMGLFSDFVYLFTSKDEALAGIRHALDENSPPAAQERKEFAATHSWENSVSRIYKAIDHSSHQPLASQNGI